MKRIISFLICFLLMLGMSANINAENIDAKVTENIVDELNEAWLEVLGVSASVSDDYVTRGEFIISIIRLMNIDKSCASSQCFADVDAKTELGAAVETALSLKIISSAETFMPDNKISYSEACKIAVSALGYSFDAERMGGYPNGYISAASKLGLTFGMDYGYLNKADFIDFMTIITHSVVRDIKSVYEDDGEFLIEYKEGETFIEKYHNLKKIDGVIEANNLTSIYTASQPADEGKIVIDEYTYNCDTDYPLGYYAYGYGDANDNIVYLWLDENRVDTVLSTQIPQYKNGYIHFYDDIKEKKVKLSNNVLYIKNGQAVTNGTAYISINDGYIELIDNNNDGTVDVVKIYESSFVSVGTANRSTEVISDENSGTLIMLEEKTYSFNGTDFDKIKAGDVLEYYISPDGEFYDFNYCVNTVSGKITGTSDDGNIIILGDVSYELTEYFKKYYAGSVSIGTHVKAYLSHDGKIIKFEVLNDSSMKYGYVFDYSDKSGSIDKSLKVKMCTDSGDVMVYTLADKVIFNGKSKSDTEVYSNLSSSGEVLIRYTENDGVIKKINTAEGSSEFYDINIHGTDSLLRYQYKDYDTSTKITYNSSGYFVPFFFVNNNTVVFSVKSPEKESDERKRFSVGYGADFLYGIGEPPRYTIQAYNVSDTGYAGCVVYADDGSKDYFLGSRSAPHAIVADVKTVIDLEGEARWQLTLYWSNYYFKVFVDPEAEYVNNPNFKQGYDTGKPPFTPGDYIRYKLNGDEMIYAHKPYDYKNDINNGYQREHNIDLNFYNGNPVKVSDGTIAIYVTQGSGDNGSVCYFLLPSTYVLVTAEGMVMTRPSSELESYVNNPDCGGVFISCQDSNTRAVVVYEK